MSDQSPILSVECLRDTRPPAYATPGAAAFDLPLAAFLSGPDFIPMESPGDDDLAYKSLTLAPGLQVWVGTGLRVSIPPGYMLQLAPRSGLGAMRGLVLGNSIGIIDSDYRQEVKLALWNRGEQGIGLDRGDRVAQAALVPAPQARIEPVASIEATDRGGFGSTGK